MKESSKKIPPRGKKDRGLQNKIKVLKNGFSIPKITDEEAKWLLASLIDILPGTFYRCRIDKKWTMEFLSPGCLKLTGYEPDELIENKKIAFGDIIHPDDQGTGWEKIQQAIKQKIPFQHTYRIRTKEGQEKWVWEQGKAIYSPQGEAIALAGIITDITELKAAEQELRRSAEEARRLGKEKEIVANIGRIISSSLDIEEIYDRFAEEAKKIISFDRISVNIIDYEKEIVKVIYTTGVKVPGREPGDIFPFNGSVNQEVAQKRMGLIIQPKDEEDFSSLSPIKKRPFQAGIKSQMAVPLIFKDKVIGILSYLSQKLDAYTETDLRIGASIASQIAGAIANAQLYREHKLAEEALRKSEEEAQRLACNNALVAEVGKIISSSLEISDVYKFFAEAVKKIIPFDWLAITIIDQKRGVFYNAHTLESQGVNIPERSPGMIIPLSGSFTEEIVRRRSGVIIQMEDQDEIGKRFPKLSPFLKRGFRSFLAVPLIHFDEVVGALHAYSYQRQAYSEDDLALAESIGSQIAGAIANAQLYKAHKKVLADLQKSEEESRRLAKENEIVANIGRIINSTLDINKVYELFAEEVYKVISFNRIAITLIDYEKRIFTSLYRAGVYVPGRTAQDIVELEGSFTEEIMRQKKGLLLQTGNEKDLVNRFPKLSPFWKIGFRSFMGLPLISQDKVFGALHIYSLKPYAYKEADLDLAQRIANQIAGAIANAQLYEERQKALAELKNSEERYRALVEHFPDMILLHDYEKYIYANPAAIRILGASQASDLIGRSIWETIHPDSREIVKDRHSLLQAGKSAPLLEEKYISLDGKVMEVEVMASPFIYQGQNLVQVVARDITEKKRAEREMAQLQEQLREAQKMETIGRLAGGIAHEFNNLLTVIQGNCQLLLLNLQEGDSLRNYITDIHRASQRAADLTRQMLAFGRRQILSLKVVDLNKTLLNMEKMIRGVIGEEIELLTILDENLAKVKVDPGQMEHVVMSLVINAKDAMPSGGKLTLKTANVDLNADFIRSHPEMKPGRYVMLSITDTGVGMSPAVKEKCFEPFFTTKEVGKGTGLSLSTVYGIIKQSGGHIFVESELGKGATFKIFLPQVEERITEEKIQPQEISFFGEKETVLVVEDHQDVRELVGQILKKDGYKVLEAKNGPEALSLAHKFKEKIHLLLTDVVMPEMSGVELARALLALHPEMKLLYMSGYSENEIVHHGLLLPGVELIQKPFSITALSKRVRELLNK